VGDFLKIEILGHPNRAKTLGAEIQNGTTIVRKLVDGGLLATMGFEVNDKIVSVDGVPVHDQQGLGAAWREVIRRSHNIIHNNSSVR
jgi:C-terminal processing protease CtpA/Prc